MRRRATSGTAWVLDSAAGTRTLRAIAPRECSGARHRIPRACIAACLAVQLTGGSLLAEAAARAMGDDEQYRTPDGRTIDIPAEYQPIWRFIPDTSVKIGGESVPYRLIFLTLCTGPQQVGCVTAQQRSSYADLLTMRRDQPQRWRAMLEALRAKVQALGLDYEVAIDPEYLLEKNLEARATASRRSDGTPWVRVNPQTVLDVDLLDLALAHEDVHVKQHRSGASKPIAGESRDLWEAKLEVPAYARELRVALEKIKGVNSQTEGPRETKLRGEVRRIHDRLTAFVAAAGGAVGSPDQVFVFKRLGEPATLQELTDIAKQDVAKQTEAKRKRLSENKVTAPPETEIPFVLDPDTGNIGFADRILEGRGMEHDQIAEAMGFDSARMVRGFFRFDGDTSRWVLSVEGVDTSVLAPTKDFRFWHKMLAGLQSHPEGHLFDGMIIEIGGRAEIEPGSWWQFDYHGRRLVRIEPQAPRDPTQAAWRQGTFLEELLGKPSESFNDEETAGRMPAASPLADPPPPPPPPAAPPAIPPRKPAPRDPVLEAEIERFLDGYTLERLKQEAAARDFSIFKNELFKRGGGTGTSAEQMINAWKAVCAKPKFVEHSGLLAFMRQEVFVDFWSQVTAEHQIRLDLIDSGKRRGYISDLDVTAYSPSDLRGKTMQELIGAFAAKFKDRYHYEPGLDITIHDGELFIPDVRNSGQSVEEYTAELHRVVNELRAKVAAGGDAYVVPGANLAEVQRRGLRDGRVIQLKPVLARDANGELRMTVDRHEDVVSRLDPQPGQWKFITNSQRFEGITPVYDPGEAFPILVENIEHMRKNGEDATLFLKYFNRGVNTGAGAGQINSFGDIHNSTLTESMRTPDLRMIDQAFAAESRGPVDHAWMKTWGMDKTFLKTRWVIKAFGLQKGADAEVMKLYELLDTSAEMERQAAKGNFAVEGVDPRTGRRWLEPYLADAEKLVDAERPDLRNKPDSRAKAVREAAYRKQARAMYDAVIEEMVKNIRTVMAETTPEGMRRNSFRYMNGPNGPEVLPNNAAAAKQAERRRVELGLAGQLISGIPDPEVRKKFFATIEDKLPPEAAAQALDLLRAANVENALRKAAPSANKTVADIRLEAARRISKGQVTEQEAAALPEKTFVERQRERILNWVHPLDAPLAERVMARFTEWDKALVDQTSKDAFSRMLTDNVFMTGLMTGAAVTGMALAYRQGGWVAARAAGLNYAFMLLPPIYGVPGMFMKDFALGHFKEGLISIGMLGLMHQLPGLGDAMFLWDVTKGSYTLITEEQNDDLIEQAFKSRPAPGLEHATRNPVTLPKLSASLSYIAAQDTPAFPLFYDDACMNGDVDNGKTMEELLPMSAQMFRPKIWKEMIKEGYKPAEYWQVFGLSETPDLMEWDSSAWDTEYQKRVRKYAFDVPYYQRISHICGCYNDKIQSAKEHMGWTPDKEITPKKRGAIENWTSSESWSEWWNGTQAIGGVDFSSPYAAVFSKAVGDWFLKQPPAYREQFDSVTDFGTGATSRRVLRTLTAQSIGLFDSYCFADSQRDTKEREIAEKMLEEGKKNAIAQKTIAAFWEKVLPQIQTTFTGVYTRLLSVSETAAAPQLRLDAPRTYVALTAAPVPGTETAKDSAGRPAGGDFMFSLSDASGLEVEALGDRAAYPQPWTAGVQFDVNGLQKGPPPGFVPTTDEQKQLAEVGPSQEPLNGVVTLNLTAQAVAYRAAAPGGEPTVEFARSLPASIVGYAIVPIPSYAGTITLTVHGLDLDDRGQRVTTNVAFEASVERQVQRGGGEAAQEVIFDKLKPQTYTVSVRSLDPDYDNGSATFEIKDPFVKQNLGQKVDQTSIVEVVLKHKPKPVTTTTQNQPTGPLVQPPGNEPATSTHTPPPADPNAPAAPGTANEQPPAQPPQPVQPNATAITQALDGIGQLTEQCEYEAALTNARAMQQEYASSPAAMAALAALIPNLEPLAKQQHETRAILARGQQAIRGGNVDGAIAALVEAATNAPPCMQASIQSLLTELVDERARQRIAAIDNAELNCDYVQASALAHAFAGLSPRTPAVDEWVATNVPRIDDLLARHNDAQELIAEAKAVGSGGGGVNGFLASTPDDWADVLVLLQEARAVPPPDCDLSRIDGLIGQAAAQAPPETSQAGGESGVEPSILGGTTTTVDPGTVTQGGQGTELGGKPATPTSGAGTGTGTAAGASGTDTHGGPAGSTGGSGTGSGTGSGSGSGTGGSGGSSGSGGAGGSGGSGGSGGGSGGSVNGCSECFVNRCQSICRDAIVLLCVVSEASDACWACARGCGSGGGNQDDDASARAGLTLQFTSRNPYLEPSSCRAERTGWLTAPQP